MELQSRDWQPNEFVGFFSPSFFEKTGLEFNDIDKSYQKYQNSKDVILFSSFFFARDILLVESAGTRRVG